MTVLVLIGMFFVIIWEDIFKVSASAAASEFCKLDQIVIDLYISHLKYQVKPHSYAWFSATSAADIEVTFFVCTRRISHLNLK